MDAVVVSVARTPFGKFGGRLRNISTPKLGALLIDELLKRTPIDPEKFDNVFLGTAVLGGAVLSPARQSILLSRLSDSVASMNVDRACCSGATAIGLALRHIQTGDSELSIAGGAENMSNTPFLLHHARWGHKLGDFKVEDFLHLRSPFAGSAIAKYVGEVALQYGVTRQLQDEWAYTSHHRYFKALDSGKIADEVFPVYLEDGVTAMSQDECPRHDCDLEKLLQLPTVYDSPTVTAGNAPPLSDGAAGIVVASREFALTHGLPVLGTLLAHVAISERHTSSAYIPALAINKLLQRSGISLKDVELVEINEAFAATALVSMKVLSETNSIPFEELTMKTNVNGGSVAIGHPLGASGARITISAINELRRRGGGYACVAICGGYGQGDAILIKV